MKKRDSIRALRIFASLLAGFASGLLYAQDAKDGGFTSAQFVNQSVAQQMDVGSTQTVDIEIKNVGTTAWTKDDQIVLVVQDPGMNASWGISQVELGEGEIVAPGTNKTFSFDLTAPLRPDVYPFLWRLSQRGEVVAGTAGPAINIRVDDPLWRAQLISQLVPDRVAPGENFRVLIQYKNSGSSSWSPERGHRLAALTSDAKQVWGTDSIALPGSGHIVPGQTATFTFSATAPTKPGRYPFQWQMYDNERQWFGEATPAVLINVGQPPAAPGVFSAKFMSQVVPAVMHPDETYAVTLVFQNTGEEDWRYPQVKLVSTQPGSSVTWTIDTVDMKPRDVVLVGELRAFHFNIRAPSEPGHYQFQWQPTTQAGRPFGEPSEAVFINVLP